MPDGSEWGVDPKWIADQLEKSKRTQRALADWLGLEPPQVNKILKKKRNISSDEADRIREFFRMALTEPPSVEFRALPRDSVVDANVTSNLLSPMNRDIPIVGRISVGVGALQVDGDVVEWVRRPPRLAGRADVRAFYIEDPAMVPAFKIGALILVEGVKARPPAPGDDVVIECRSEIDPEDRRTIVRNLVAVTTAGVTIQQYTPPETCTLAHSLIVHMLRIIPLIDLLAT